MVEDVQRSRGELGEENKGLWSLVDYLNIYSFDPRSQCYTMADGSIGTVIEMDPIGCTTASDDELEEISSSVALAFSQLKEKITGQILLIPSVDVSRELSDYKRYGGTQNPVLASVEKRKIEFLEKMRITPVFQRGDCPFKVKKFRVLVTIYMRPDEKVGGVLRSLRDAINMGGGDDDEEQDLSLTPEENRFYRFREKLTRYVVKARKTLVDSLGRQSRSVEVVGPEALIAGYRTLMYPRSVATVQHRWDQHRPLSEQIPISGMAVDPAKGEVLTDDVCYRVLSYSQPSEFSEPGRLSLPTRELNFLSFLDYVSNGFIAINFVVLDKDYMRKFIETSRRFVNGGMCREARKPVLVNDLDLADHYVENEKRRFFDVSMTVCIYGDTSKQVRDEVESLQDKLTEIGVDSRVETYVSPSCFFQSLPFGFGPTLAEAKRTFLLPDRALSDLAPIYSNGRGSSVGKKGSPYLVQNRMGELFNLDVFATTAPHWVMVGNSGSGKSFSATNMVADYLRDPDAQAFFIDKGRSYRTFTNMLGNDGSYNNMGLSQKTCMNAFAGTYSMAGSFLMSLLQHLCARDESEALTAQQIGKLEKKVTECYHERQIEVEYVWYRDLKKRYPEMWVDRALKRFTVDHMDATTLAQVRALAGDDVGDDGPPFEFYHVAALGGKKIFDSGLKTERMEQYKDVNSLPHDVTNFLVSRDFRVEDMPDPDNDGSTFVALLYTSKQAEQTLQMDNFHFIPLQDFMVLEVGHEDIFGMLVDNNVQIHMDQEFFDGWAERFRQEILADQRYLARVQQLESNDAEVRTEAENIIADLVEERIGELDVMAVWEHVPGTATLQGEVFMRNLHEKLLESQEPDLLDIASRLNPYTGAGQYAGFFDGRTGFRLRGKKVVTFELQELASAGGHLLAAVVGSLLQMIVLYGQEEDVRGNRKMLILDEFWQLLENKMVADNVVNLYRTARKFNTSTGVISQSITDLTGVDAGRTILANAPTRILMRQEKSVCAQLDELLDFTEVEMAVMKTVNTEPGFYSEAFISVPEKGISDVMRLVSTPYFYAFATTNAADVKMREKLRKDFRAQGASDVESIDMALSEFSERWPAGVERGEVKR